MAVRERSAADYVPDRPTLAGLRRAAQACRGCDLYKGATQAVVGEGPARARLMLVGEQPGDREDREGRPFVGPAGQLLDRALAAAGLERRQVYLTNAVKHFKWRREGGKRRLHEKPTPNEARACRPWLEAEAGLLRPAAVVALGATAARSLFGPSARVMAQRGRIFASEWAGISSMTVHPSALLRIPDSDERKRAEGELVRDLRAVRDALAGAGGARSEPKASGVHRAG
jgi:DNA polymerase